MGLSPISLRTLYESNIKRLLFPELSVKPTTRYILKIEITKKFRENFAETKLTKGNIEHALRQAVFIFLLSHWSILPLHDWLKAPSSEIHLKTLLRQMFGFPKVMQENLKEALDELLRRERVLDQLKQFTDNTGHLTSKILL